MLMGLQIALFALLPAAAPAQPDLNGWVRLIRSMEDALWVQDLEAMEPGAVLSPLQPDLEPSRWWKRSDWAELLIAQLEMLPMASHHADRALNRMLADGMLTFRLMECAADRHRIRMESAFEQAGLPMEWAILPMALTGWDQAYYGPGRRAGPWAMDVTSALSHGLDIRRGWDERHIEESMERAAVERARIMTGAFPGDPMRQVIAFVQGPQAAERFDPESLNAEGLEWGHLLRVILQVDRNFNRDGTAALWVMRDRNQDTFSCPKDKPWLHFSLLSDEPAVVQAIKVENPWYTLDSVGFHPLRPQLLVPGSLTGRLKPAAEACGVLRKADAPLAVVLHTVGPGEVLGTIARDYGVRIEAIIGANGLEGDLIRAGQTLRIPGGIPPPEGDRGRTQRQDREEGTWIWHTVQPGESYWTISQRYPQAGLQDLLEMNDIRPESLQPGMKLRIPPP